MEKSTSIKNLAKALTVFNAAVNKVAKDAENPYFRKNYASLSNILSAIKAPLHNAGLTINQFPSGENGLITILIHADSGEYMQAEYNMAPVKNDPQARGSAITYQRRYAVCAILGINIEEDDDGNAGTHTAAPQQKHQAPAKTNGQARVTTSEIMSF